MKTSIVHARDTEHCLQRTERAIILCWCSTTTNAVTDIIKMLPQHQTPAAVSGALTSFLEQGNEVNTVSHTHSKDGAFRGCLELKRVLRNGDAVGAEQL
jgi:hypothetical protein